MDKYDEYKLSNQRLGGEDDFSECPNAFRQLTLDDDDDQHRHFGEETVWRSVALEDNYDDEVDSFPAHGGHGKELYLGDPSLPYEHEHAARAFQGKSFGGKVDLDKSNIIAAPAATSLAPAPRRQLVLPAEPAWVEPWSSFVSKSNPTELIRKVQEILSEHEHLDHEKIPEQASLRGLVSALDGTTVNFQLSLYSRPGSETILAEVQRRRGCIVAFGSFYRSLVKKLGDTYVMCQLADEEAIAGGAAPALSSFTALDFPPSATSSLPAFDLSPISSDAVKDICEMAKSQERDVSGEGMRALAGVSHQECNLHVLVEHAKPIMELVSMTLNEGGDSSRAAASLVANLARSPNEGMQALLTSTLLGKLLQTLDEPSSLENRRTKRQVARALMSLGCTTHKTHIAVHKAKLEKHMRRSSDPRLNNLLATTLKSCS